MPFCVFKGQTCSVGVYQRGQLVQTPVLPTLSRGGQHVAAELSRLIHEALGPELMQEFKQRHPTAWDSIECNMENIRETLEIGYLGQMLQERGIANQLGHNLKLISYAGKLLLELPPETRKTAYSVITQSAFIRSVKAPIQSAAYDHVFLVGGLAKANIVKDFLRQGAPRNVTVLTPSSLESYAMLGGCVYGAEQLAQLS